MFIRPSSGDRANSFSWFTIPSIVLATAFILILYGCDSATLDDSSVASQQGNGVTDDLAAKRPNFVTEHPSPRFRFADFEAFKNAMDSVRATENIRVNQDLFDLLNHVLTLEEMVFIDKNKEIEIGDIIFRFTKESIYKRPENSNASAEVIDVYYGESGREHIGEMVNLVANSDRPNVLAKMKPRDPTVRRILAKVKARGPKGIVSERSAGKPEGLNKADGTNTLMRADTDIAYFYPAGTKYYSGGSDFPAGNYQVRFISINNAYGNWFSGRGWSATTAASVKLSGTDDPYFGIGPQSWGFGKYFWLYARVVDEFTNDWGSCWEWSSSNVGYGEVTTTPPWARPAFVDTESQHSAHLWNAAGNPVTVPTSYERRCEWETCELIGNQYCYEHTTSAVNPTTLGYYRFNLPNLD